MKITKDSSRALEYVRWPVAAHRNISPHLQLALPPALAWTLHFCHWLQCLGHKPSARTSAYLRFAFEGAPRRTCMQKTQSFFTVSKITSAARRVLTSFRADLRDALCRVAKVSEAWNVHNADVARLQIIQPSRSQLRSFYIDSSNPH